MSIFHRKSRQEKIQKSIDGLKGDKDALMLLVQMVPQNIWKTIIISLILEEENVTLDDLEQLLSATQKQGILCQIRERVLKIGTKEPDALLSLFLNRTGETADWTYGEFLSMTDRKSISEDHAIRILLKVIEGDPLRRVDAWKKIKELRPQKNHLRIIADMEGRIEMNGIAAEAQKLMAETGRKRVIKKVKKIADLIKGQD